MLYHGAFGILREIYFIYSRKFPIGDIPQSFSFSTLKEVMMLLIPGYSKLSKNSAFLFSRTPRETILELLAFLVYVPILIQIEIEGKFHAPPRFENQHALSTRFKREKAQKDIVFNLMFNKRD